MSTIQKGTSLRSHRGKCKSRKFQRAAELSEDQNSENACTWNPRNYYFFSWSAGTFSANFAAACAPSVKTNCKRTSRECISAWCVSAALKLLSKSIGAARSIYLRASRQRDFGDSRKRHRFGKSPSERN